MIFKVNESTINGDLSAKKDNIYPDFDIKDNLITMSNEQLTINADSSAKQVFKLIPMKVVIELFNNV